MSDQDYEFGMNHPTVVPGNADEVQTIEPCDDPYISQLEYAPHRVPYFLTDDGELRVDSAGVELLDAPWEETDSYWCHNCDTEIEGEENAIAHLRGEEVEQ